MSDELEYTIQRAERQVTPAFTLNQIGKAAFKRAEEQQRGWRDDIITAQLMCALTMEAVLNHVGAHLFRETSLPSTWAVVDRASPRQKLAVIAEHLKLEVDTSRPPFQHFAQMFRLRNALAHARSEMLVTSEIPQDATDENNWLIEERVPGLRASWENMCDLDTARAWRESVYAMSERLCRAADCGDPVLVGDNAGWSGSYRKPDGQA